jgi:putative salt-induced outer membrane protein
MNFLGIKLPIASLFLLNPVLVFSFHFEHWENNIEFGGSFLTGNSPATTVSGRFISDLDNEYGKQPWGYNLVISGKRATAQSIETARQASSSLQLQYLFTQRWYIYGKGSLGYNAFETYDQTARDSAGIGYVIVKNNTHMWTLEGGPGGMHQRVAGTKEWQNQFIGHAETRYLLHLNSKTDVAQLIQADSGRLNSQIRSESSLVTNLYAAIALKIGIEVSHYTMIPEGSSNTKKTDTSSTIGVNYQF